MDLLNSIPPWAWALLFIVALLFVYGIFNRRWLEEERREKARKASEGDANTTEQPRAPVPAANLQVPAEAAPTPADDLTVIEGIGPRSAAALYDTGIQSYAALAQTPVEDLRAALAAAGLQLSDPATWPEQAALAAKGDWEGLKALTDTLKGGRRV